MKNKKLRESFALKACLVCRKSPCDACHIKTYATTLNDDESNLMPLCRRCHILQHKFGIVTFVRKYPAVFQYVTERGFYINDYGKLAKDLKCDDKQ